MTFAQETGVNVPFETKLVLKPNQVSFEIRINVALRTNQVKYMDVYEAMHTPPAMVTPFQQFGKLAHM